ncbi:polysaccharide biosynthesis/export family protein [Nibrella saemangeumensis]|uniref:Polysaccharide biosynthesis/export family protein n=2 Tax=Nibrella saemangeumensis TaxID=1084526 RepID=A0ABP8N5N0_9BACT
MSPRKLVYFQPKPTGEDTLTMTSRYAPKIQSGDILSIQVSSLNAEATTYFNPYVSFAAMDRSQNASAPQSSLPNSTGYLVDKNGNIDLPLVGTISVANLTTADAKDRIRERLKAYLKEPTVNVRNQNFKVSVLGEVARPTLLTIPNEQITLPEALGLAGDVTIYGRRDNVLVIREENGKKEFAHIDMTKRDLFRSPYYYLHPNDVVYVEPGKVRMASADRMSQVVPAVLSALSFISIILRYY